MSEHSFTCPKCGGHYFGRNPQTNVVECHGDGSDKPYRKCWKGYYVPFLLAKIADLKSRVAELEKRYEGRPPMLWGYVDWIKEPWQWFYYNEPCYRWDCIGISLVLEADEITEVDEALSDPRAMEIWQRERTGT